jgi:hypothetical protein
MFGEIFQAGADTFNTAVNWIMFGQEQKMLGEWRQEDLEMANLLREDQLARERWQKEFAEKEFEFKEDTFDWGKYKWGEELGFTKKQYRDQKKRQKTIDKQNKEMLQIEMKQRGLDKLGNQIVDAANRDSVLKDTLLTRYGV